MLSKTELKYLLRSHSLQFVRDCKQEPAEKTLHSYDWHGMKVWYRPGTSDPHLIYQILLKEGEKSEYFIPHNIHPETILDIGGNIGITSLYFANRYPSAKIIAFEPVPSNFSVLTRNIAPYPNITALPIALGKKKGCLEMYCSDDPVNNGGYSFFDTGCDVERKVSVEVKEINGVLSDHNIKKIDLIKIDTEGAEYDILTSFDENILSSTKWIIGELHGNKDFELLAYLSKWFDIGIKKTLGKRLCMFSACNKNLSSPLFP